MTRLTVAMLIFMGMSVAQPVPAGWKVMKSEKGTCQVAVPGGWAVDNEFNTAQDPKKLVSATIVHERDATMGPSESDAMRIVAYTPIKVFENTSKRVFLEDKVSPLGPGWPSPGRKFVAFVPQTSKGICQTRVMLKSGGTEALAKQVALTVSPAR
jgi:hypothetical protein